MADSRQEEPEAMVQRLVQATNAHDLDAMVDCFTVDYRNQTPAHPAQGFVGREQVRKNWEQIFRFVPDISVRVLRCRSDGDMVWSEWEMAGTRRDGSAHLMTGVILFGVREGQASWARFYLEPVEAAGVDVNGAVRQNVGAEATGAGRAEPEGRP
jgi:ketosteroid isomerase-like protein